MNTLLYKYILYRQWKSILCEKLQTQHASHIDCVPRVRVQTFCHYCIGICVAIDFNFLQKIIAIFPSINEKWVSILYLLLLNFVIIPTLYSKYVIPLGITYKTITNKNRGKNCRTLSALYFCFLFDNNLDTDTRRYKQFTFWYFIFHCIFRYNAAGSFFAYILLLLWTDR